MVSPQSKSILEGTSSGPVDLRGLSVLKIHATSSCVMIIRLSLAGVKKVKVGSVLSFTNSLHWEAK